jgi:hypothetical protein
MNQNTSSPGSGAAGPNEPAGPEGLPAALEGLSAGPEGLPAGLEGLAAGDPDQLGDALLAAQVVALRRLAEQLDAVWLRLLATLDAAAPPAPRPAPRPPRPRPGCARPAA